MQKISDVKFCLKHPGKSGSMTYTKYRPGCTFEGKKVLNLGCGNTTYPAPNVVNMDLYEVPGVNVVWDLSKTPLPFEDNTFDFIIANHILEHVPNWWECFKDLARIVKVGGTVEVWGPGRGDTQLGYRDHINVINHCSFVGIRGTRRNYANAWEQEDRKTHGFVNDLELSEERCALANFWWLAILPARLQNWASLYLTNVVTEYGWKFKKLPPL